MSEYNKSWRDTRGILNPYRVMGNHIPAGFVNELSEENKAKWTVIITTQCGQSFKLTSEVPVNKSDAITNALADLILKVRESVEEDD